MEESKHEQVEVEDLIVQRLLSNVDIDDDIEVKKNAAQNSVPRDVRVDQKLPPQASVIEPVVKESVAQTDATVSADTALSTTTFTKVEKSLASLGFFTPSSRRLKNFKVKEVTFNREVDGKRVEVTAKIIPSAMFGLPITADQDKYLALQKIITNILATDGEVKNPVRFKSAELLRLLGHSTNTGKNYREISEWLDVMMTTTIFSEGAVYKAGEKRFVKDRLNVFQRAISVGKEMEDGSIADANYVWFSDWQLQNINNNFLLPIDLDAYRQLKNHIAKALVPLLQIWLFASQKAGSFEKKYEELCEILTIQKYRSPSLIIRQLKPSLDELTKCEYLEKWRIEKTSDQKAYKIILFHGSKFHRDRRRRIEQKNQIDAPVVIGESEPIELELPELGKLESAADVSIPTPKHAKVSKTTVVEPVASADSGAEQRSGIESAADVEIDLTLVAELTKRGVMQSTAINLLRAFPSGQATDVYNYIDYWDSIRPDNERGKGPGLLIHFLEKRDPLPPSFETRQRKTERLAAEDKRQKLILIKEALSAEYEEYRGTVVDRYIAEVLTPETFDQRLVAQKDSISKQTGLWAKSMSPEFLEQMARGSVRTEIAKEINILPFEEFRIRELPRILAELKLDAKELGIEKHLQEPPVESA